MVWHGIFQRQKRTDWDWNAFLTCSWVVTPPSPEVVRRLYGMGMAWSMEQRDGEQRPGGIGVLFLLTLCLSNEMLRWHLTMRGRNAMHKLVSAWTSTPRTHRDLGGDRRFARVDEEGSTRDSRRELEGDQSLGRLLAMEK
jgi:hypothetical protein